MTTATTHTVEALGATWTFAQADKATRSRFAARIKANARKGLAEDKATMDPDAYRDFAGVLQDRIDAGDYTWSESGCGAAIQSMLTSTTGQVWLIQELLRPAHGDVTVEKIGEIALANPDAVRIALLAAFGLPDLSETTA